MPTATTANASKPTPTTTVSPSDYVTLVSNDGFEFVVRRSAAYVAGALRRMLDPKSYVLFLYCCTVHILFAMLFVFHIYTFPQLAGGDWGGERYCSLILEVVMVLDNFSEAVRNRAYFENIKYVIPCFAFLFPPQLPSPLFFHHLPISAFVTPPKKWYRPGKSLRILLLQREIRRSQRRAGYGAPA